MAQVPAAVASTATASIGAQVGSFVVNLGANYLLGRLAAQDGPRLGNLSAAGGEYGVAMPKLFGEKVRCTGIFIAQADIKETRHTVEDYSEIVGALTGAVQGFMVGGPVGAVVGAVIGGLLGAATPRPALLHLLGHLRPSARGSLRRRPDRGHQQDVGGGEGDLRRNRAGRRADVRRRWPPGDEEMGQEQVLQVPHLAHRGGRPGARPGARQRAGRDQRLSVHGIRHLRGPAADGVGQQRPRGRRADQRRRPGRRSPARSSGSLARRGSTRSATSRRSRSSTGSTAVIRSPARRAAGTRSSRCCRRSASTRPRCRDRSASSSATRRCARRSRPRTWARTRSATSRPSASPSPARRTSICRRRPASPSSTRRAITRRIPRARRGPRAAPSRTSA
jgi:hypothetical protein